MKKHHLCRPPEGAHDVERLTHDGRWIPDDGKSARAFSGRGGGGECLAGFPYAWAVECDCGFDDRCPHRKAMTRTCKRFHAANGHRVKPIKPKKTVKGGAA